MDLKLVGMTGSGASRRARVRKGLIFTTTEDLTERECFEREATADSHDRSELWNGRYFIQQAKALHGVPYDTPAIYKP